LFTYYCVDLHSIGGLVPLLSFLKNSHANIRAKAADVVSTIVQNNPRSQELVMETNALESLLSNFTSDTDIHARTQALGAISCKPASDSSFLVKIEMIKSFCDFYFTWFVILKETYLFNMGCSFDSP